MENQEDSATLQTTLEREQDQLNKVHSAEIQEMEGPLENVTPLY